MTAAISVRAPHGKVRHVETDSRPCSPSRLRHNERCTCQRSFGSSLRSHFICSFASELGRYTTTNITVVKVNEERHRALRRQLVAAARSLVTYQFALPLACTRLSRIAFWLRPYEHVEIPSVEQYISRVRHLPIGTERLAWDRELLRGEDVKLETIHREFRDAVFALCFQIIDRYQKEEISPPVV